MGKDKHMALFGAKKTYIDLLARYSYDPEKREKRMKILSYTLPGVLVVGLITGLILFNLFKGISLDNQISDYETKISELQSQKNEALKQQNKHDILTADLQVLKEAKDKSNQESSRYGYLDSKFLSDINSVCGKKADIKLMDFSSEGILFTFETASLNYSDISVIVKKIEQLKYFDQVTYTGYSKTSDDAYSFSVVCSFEGEDNESEVAQ